MIYSSHNLTQFLIQGPIMRYSFSSLIGMLRSPAGRLEIAEGIRYRAWPVFSRLASLHRSTVARQTKVIAVVGSFGKSTTTSAITTAFGLPLHRQFSFNCWTGVAQA